MVLGFPKSLNIGLAIDKKKGVESAVVGQNQDILVKQKKDLESGHRKIVDSFDAGASNRNNGFKNVSADIKVPTSNEGKQWQGWGTALKPSFEPIIIARKPFKGSLVENVIKWGVGGLNIDECRIEIEDNYKSPIRSEISQKKENGRIGKTQCDFGKINENAGANSSGRFPANTLLTYDENDYAEVCGGFPITKQNGSIKNPNLKNSLGNGGIYNRYSENQPLWEAYLDSGSASRYFYCAKASGKDRDEGLEEFDSVKCSMMASNDNIDSNGNFTGMLAGRETSRKNIHPTVKPTELMQYLVRLVSPKGATILDPFMGSGSTGKAAAYENKERQANYNFIGIELNKEYCDIAEARIEYISQNSKCKDNKDNKDIEDNKFSDNNIKTLFSFDI